MAQNPSNILAALEAEIEEEPATTPDGIERAAARTLARAEPGAAAALSSDLPPIILAAAGLAVFDAIICLVYLVVWVTSPPTLLAIIHAMAGISLLLGVSPIIVAGVIFSKNRQTGVEMPGTPFAVWAMISGGLMVLLTLAVPLAAAIQTLVGSGGS